jgi:hypothetical protein
VEHSSIPHLWSPDTPGNGFVGKEGFSKKSFLEDGVNYRVTRGLKIELRTG